MFATPSSAATELRRFWWLFLLVMVTFDAGLPRLLRGTFGEGSGPWAWLAWLPFGLHLACRLLLVGVLWTSLKEGGRVQILLALQAAIPLLSLALNHLFLPFLLGRGGVDWSHADRFIFLVPLLAEVAALCGAFWLRAQEPEEGELGVAASAGLAVLGQGWLAVGLLPLLARLWNDPLLNELGPADEDSEQGAFRASLLGFLLLFFGPVLLWLDFRPGAWEDIRFRLLGPSLLIGAVSWCRFGAALGVSGKVWRVFTWILVGLSLALSVAGLVLLLTFSRHGLRL